MPIEMFERALALVAAIVVGGSATWQLKDELGAHGLDAQVTKGLLGLLIVGCLLCILASIHVIGDLK
jgi:hypothetical protein